MSAPWIIVVDGGDHRVAALREAVRAAAEPLGPVRVEERDGRFLLVLPSKDVHPAAVAVQFPAVLAGRLGTTPDAVLLVIDRAADSDRAVRLIAALRGPAADPPLTYALTQKAWRALTRGENPVPLRDFRKVTIYDQGDVLDAWIRSPDEPDAPASERPARDYLDAGRDWAGPGKGVVGPPPGPEFPTDR